jgi:hypothetical protein
VLSALSAGVELSERIAVDHDDMAFKRLSRVLATSAVAVAVGGGAPAALAEDATSKASGDVPAAHQRPATTSLYAPTAKTAAQRQRRTEAGWLAEQLRAERATQL